MPILVSRASAATVSFSTPQEIIISHTDDSIRLGDGTTLVGVTLTNELKTSDADTHTKLDEIQTNTLRKFSTASNTRPTITNVSAVVLAANSNRRYAYILNQTGVVVHLALGQAAVFGQQIRLANNDIYEITADNLFTGDIHGIKNLAAAAQLEVFEGTP